MSFDGFYSLGGIELVNAARTTAYVKNQLPGLPLKRIAGLETIHVALGDEPYESPLIDDAEWVNPADPATHGFFGLYPLSVQGISDSTRGADVTEALLAGGTVGEARDATRAIRMRGLLVAADQLALEAGHTWLRAAVAADNCGMHGGLCGSTDLRYFLAKPDVCDPKWVHYGFLKNEGSDGPGYWDAAVQGNGVGNSFVVHRDGRLDYGVIAELGPLSRDTSPLIYSLDVDASMPAIVDWILPRVDGVSVRWGRIALRGPEGIFTSPRVTLQRTNFVTNPSFTAGLDGYEIITPGTHLERVATGGVDDGAYGTVVDDAEPTYRTNWFANPRFTSSPELSGWRSNGDISTIADPAAPQGGTAGRFFYSPPVMPMLGYGEAEYGTDGYGGVSAAQAPLYVEQTLLGPAIPTQSTISFWVGPSQNLELAILSPSGQPSNVTTILGSTAWRRVSWTTLAGANYNFRISTFGTTLLLNGLLLEEGGLLGSFFDGSFTDNPDQEVYYSYLGDPVTTPSRVVAGAVTPYTISVNPVETAYGDLVASFALRSMSSATVTAQIVSLDDGTILAESIVDPDGNWQRYALATPYGRAVKLTISGVGSVDLDQVLIEPNELVSEYYDGETSAPEGYVNSWLGAPFDSYSRQLWTGTTTLRVNDSDWRPFLEVVTGALPTVSLRYFIAEDVPMSEQLEPYERNFHRVSIIQGPTTIADHHLSVGAVREVEIIMAAATPYAYSLDRSIPTVDRTTALFTDPVVEVIPPLNLLLDPDCAPVPAPPRPPVIPELCVEDLTSWRRYWYSIPSEDVALWAGTVPTITLSSRQQEIRQLRIRFHANPFAYEKEIVDPLGYCGEMIVSYLPPDAVLIANGMTERAFAQVGGSEPLPADHLLYGTGGTPMQWPEMSCGIPYVMTVDVPPTVDVDDIDVQLVLNKRE